MRALVVTNLWPTPAHPGVGVFVRDEVDGLRSLGVEVDVLHLDRSRLGRRVYLRTARELARGVASGRPDLVHVMYGGVMAEIVTRRAGGLPVLVSFCGTDLLSMGEGGPGAMLSRRQNRGASVRAARRADGIVVKSRNLADALPSGLDPDRVWLIPDGVDLDLFAPRDRDDARAELGWSPAVRHVVFPAAPSRPEKNYPLAAAAVELVRAAGADVELHALHGVEKREVPTWLNAADALLLTSTHEGSPNAVKEALACDLPVVAVDVGDVEERLAGIDGCHVCAPAAGELAAALRSTLERGGRVAGRDRVRDLSLPVLARRLQKVYENLADRGASRPGNVHL
jgi:glycosyltransferase involved in cell wall biosynthesis